MHIIVYFFPFLDSAAQVPLSISTARASASNSVAINGTSAAEASTIFHATPKGMRRTHSKIVHDTQSNQGIYFNLMTVSIIAVLQFHNLQQLPFQSDLVVLYLHSLIWTMMNTFLMMTDQPWNSLLLMIKSQSLGQ